MAADFTIDLIDGGDYEKSYDNGRFIERGTRVASVTGLNGTATPATALITARQIVEAAHPIGEQYAVGSIARVVGFRSEGLSQDDGAARVRVLYDTPFGDGGDGSGEPVWLVEDDSEQEQIQTQIDPATGVPLRIKWEWASGKFKTDIATATVNTTIRRLVLSGILTSAQRETYRIAAGRVNQAAFLGMPKGAWWFRSFRTHTRIGAAFYYATCELVCKSDGVEDWSVYEVYTEPDGHRAVVTDAEMSRMTGLAYQFGVQPGNGVIRIGPMQTEDFTALFNITLIP